MSLCPVKALRIYLQKFQNVEVIDPINEKCLFRSFKFHLDEGSHTKRLQGSRSGSANSVKTHMNSENYC